MSGSRSSTSAWIGKQMMFSKPSKSGKLRTLRRMPKVTDYDWSQTVVGIPTSAVGPAGHKPTGSSRSTVQNMFQSSAPLSQISSQSTSGHSDTSTSAASGGGPFGGVGQIGRPTLPFYQPSVLAAPTDHLYISEASFNLTLKQSSSSALPKKDISTSSNKPSTSTYQFSSTTKGVDSDAMLTTEKIFEFLWEPEIGQSNKSNRNNDKDESLSMYRL